MNDLLWMSFHEIPTDREASVIRDCWIWVKRMDMFTLNRLVSKTLAFTPFFHFGVDQHCDFFSRHFLYISSVDKGLTIRWLYFCWGFKTARTSVLNWTLTCLWMVRLQELWGLWNTLTLLIRFGILSPKVVVNFRVWFMGQINLFNHEQNFDWC